MGSEQIGGQAANLLGVPMPAASALRIEIERAMGHRFPAALTPAPRSCCDHAETEIAEVDALLDGGLPIGARGLHDQRAASANAEPVRTHADGGGEKFSHLAN